MEYKLIYKRRGKDLGNRTKIIKLKAICPPRDSFSTSLINNPAPIQKQGVFMLTELAVGCKALAAELEVIIIKMVKYWQSS